MIPRNTIDQILAAANIEEVIADYVELKKKGANLVGRCPFHEEKTGSFTVSPAKGIFKCFGCSKAGDVVKFIREKEQCGYIEALKILAQKYHIPVEEKELSPEDKQREQDRESMFVVNDFAVNWYEEQLWNTPEGKAIGLSYLRQRGLRDDIIDKFRIGYSPDRSSIGEDALKKEYQEKYIVNDATTSLGTGICFKSDKGQLIDRFHSRVIFPFISRSGKVVGFAGRIIKKNEHTGKYVNSPTSTIFEKHNELFGIFQAKNAIARQNCCYLVEGQLDVISMHQAGVENVVASGGTSLTEQQIKLIKQFTTKIVVLYDGDKAGIKAAIRGIDMILNEGINVKVIALPEGEDPDSFSHGKNSDEFIQFLQNNQVDFIRFKTELLTEEMGNDPVKRAELIQDIVHSIAVIPNEILREEYIKECATLLNRSEEMLQKELQRQRFQLLQDKKKKPGFPGRGTAQPYMGQPHTKLSHTEQPQTEQPHTEEPQTEGAVPTPRVNTTIEKNIENLIKLLLKHGTENLYQNAQGEWLTVGEYVIHELKEDSLSDDNPLHKRFLSEYASHYQDPEFNPEEFFTQHPDQELKAYSEKLLTPTYQLSRIYYKQTISENVQQEIVPETDEDNLYEITFRFINELKYIIVDQKLSDLKQEIKSQPENSNLQMEITQLIGMRRFLSGQLGNRIITPQSKKTR